MTEKTYKLTVTESQLRLIANAIEDWSRFLSGQCEMDNALLTIWNADLLEAREILSTKVKPHITPGLPLNSSYSWNGGRCPNKEQKKAIAMSYGIYREIRHYFATHPKDPDHWNCYQAPTLLDEQQGPLIEIEEYEGI